MLKQDSLLSYKMLKQDSLDRGELWYNTRMNLQKIQFVLADQRDYCVHLLSLATCARTEEVLINLNSKLAQVVTGVRRSGKSTMCLNVLKKSGRPFAYVNFDDERFSGFIGSDFETLLTAAIKVYGSFDVFFLDEPQNVPEWPLFVNRLLRGGIHVVVTGSNSNLLGGELATHMTGRYNEIKLLPFSFKEYCDFKGVDASGLSVGARADRSAAFDVFLRDGAFPEVAEGENPKRYIGTLVESIRTKDIEKRYRIRYKSSLHRMIDHILNTVPAEMDFDALAKQFSFGSKQTAANYVEYMERSFLVNRVSKFSHKSKLRIFGEKMYPVDVSLMNARENAFQGDNLGWRLETVVGLELVRRARMDSHDVYYYRDSRHECDFVVCENRKANAAYQVCYDISSEKTMRREIEGAVAAAKACGLDQATILTYSEMSELRHSSGIRINIMPAPEWLCQIGG